MEVLKNILQLFIIAHGISVLFFIIPLVEALVAVVDSEGKENHDEAVINFYLVSVRFLFGPEILLLYIYSFIKIILGSGGRKNKM